MIFAVGDIHGCATELRLLLEKLQLTPDSTVIFLGDYVDRGPESKQVIDTILELKKFCNVVCLMGNHEAMFLDFIHDPYTVKAGAFIFNGGSSTLASYADESGDYAVPQEHLDFLNTLHISYEIDGYYFVHAGLPEMPIEEIDPRVHKQPMLWMRGNFLTTQYQWSKIVVHGHTPRPNVYIARNRINLDTACVYQGRLTAMSFPDRTIYSVRSRVGENRRLLRDMSSRRIAIRFDGAIPVYGDVGASTHEFETINYSEAGMYMRDLLSDGEYVYEQGAIITGIIGHHEDEFRARFRGRVVRRRADTDGVHYAVKIMDLE